MYVYVINFVKLCHRYVLMCCSDSMNSYVWGCLCIEVFLPLQDSVQSVTNTSVEVHTGTLWQKYS
jgi:hypothetical protein